MKLESAKNFHNVIVSGPTSADRGLALWRLDQRLGKEAQYPGSVACRLPGDEHRLGVAAELCSFVHSSSAELCGYKYAYCSVMLLETGILDLVGTIPVGVILVSADRQVLALNRRATEIIQKNDSLAISNNVLSGVQSGQTKILQVLIAGALRSGNSSNLSYPMLIPRVQSRPLMVVVVPAVSAGLGVHAGGIAAVLANDPDFRCQPNEQLMRSLFQLTPMESRLASLLIQGTPLANAAKEMSVTLHTVRTYLKVIFQKTGTNRQSDLMYLMLNSPVSMSLDIRAITFSGGTRTAVAKTEHFAAGAESGRHGTG